jgi:hypothetical protein
MKLFGNLGPRVDERSAYTVSEENLEGKRPFGRLRHRWEKN